MVDVIILIEIVELRIERRGKTYLSITTIFIEFIDYSVCFLLSTLVNT